MESDNVGEMLTYSFRLNMTVKQEIAIMSNALNELRLPAIQEVL